MLPLHWETTEVEAGMYWGGGSQHARETKGLANETSCIETLAKLSRQDRAWGLPVHLQTAVGHNWYRLFLQPDSAP